jgi:hypothetical protein
MTPDTLIRLRSHCKKMENKLAHYKERAACQHLTFLPRSKRKVNCHNANQEPNYRISIDQVLLSEEYRKTITNFSRDNDYLPNTGQI